LPPVEKLKGIDDYNDWKFAMQQYLEHEDLWGCVMGDTTAVQNSRNMAKAKAKIVLSVDKVNYTHIRDATTPKEVWDKLKKTFEDKGLTRKVGLLRTLITTQLENCENPRKIT